MPDQNTQMMIGDFLKGGSAIAGSVTQANAITQQNQFEQQVFDFNSAMATVKAQEAQIQGNMEENLVGDRTRAEVGRQKAILAGGGIVSSTGTGLLAQEQTETIGAHDALMAKINAQRLGLNYQTQAMEAGQGADLENLASQTKARSTIWSGLSGGLSDVSEGFIKQFPAPPPVFGTPEPSTSGMIDWDTIHQSVNGSPSDYEIAGAPIG